MAKKSTPWSVEEVTKFLHYIADDKIQRELDRTTRNKSVSGGLYTDVHKRLLEDCRAV